LVDNFDSLPIYRQLIEEIKINIFGGLWRAGEKIPSVRDLASQYRVNPNTMQRALAELENEGLLYTDRTTGKFVTCDIAVINASREMLAKSRTDIFAESMRKIGYNVGEIKFVRSNHIE